MAIYNFCKCKTAYSLELKKCPKCGEPSEKKYRVEIMVNKKRVSKIVPNLTLAKNLEAKLKTELIEGDYFDRSEGNYTLNEIWKMYCETRENIAKSLQKTIYKYDHIIKPFLGSKQIRQITPQIMEQFKIKMSKTLTQYGKPYSNKSICDIIMIVSALFNFAKKILKCQIENPCEFISKPKINNEVMNVLTADDKRNLLKALDAHDDQNTANCIKLLLYSGLRLNEALKLEWKDIDFNGKILYIRDPKSGYNETIPLNETALTILQTQFSLTGNKTNICFPGPRKDERNHIRWQWSTIKAKAGIDSKFRLHDLRHNFASDLVSQGVSLYIVQKLLRHRNPKMTQRYAHLFDDVLRNASELFGK